MIWDFENLLSRRLMLWAVLSIIVGAALLAFGAGNGPAVGLQGLLWGAIDALIAFFGLRKTSPHLGQPSSRVAEIQEASRLRKVLWINYGLDALYLLAGLALVFFTPEPVLFWAGTGWGILIQGGFLFFFDLYHARKVPDPLELPLIPLFTHPDHEPFLYKAGKPAALLVHGFPGTALEMRSVGKTLHEAGWTVRGVRLPGFGSELVHLIEYNNAQWVKALETEYDFLQAQGYDPRLLVGYSFGGSLALQLASRRAFDALILLAPLTWQEPPWASLPLNYVRALLPLHVSPLRLVPVDHPQFKDEFWQYLPELNFTDPALAEEAKNLQVPLFILDQLREVGREALKAAPLVHTPTLVIQGQQDRTVSPQKTAILQSLLAGPVSYETVNGSHGLTMPGNPSLNDVLAKVVIFASASLSSERPGAPG